MPDGEAACVALQPERLLEGLGHDVAEIMLPACGVPQGAAICL